MNMITLGIETQNGTQKVPRQRPGQEARRVAVGRVRKQRRLQMHRLHGKRPVAER